LANVAGGEEAGEGGGHGGVDGDASVGLKRKKIGEEGGVGDGAGVDKEGGEVDLGVGAGPVVDADGGKGAAVVVEELLDGMRVEEGDLWVLGDALLVGGLGGGGGVRAEHGDVRGEGGEGEGFLEGVGVAAGDADGFSAEEGAVTGGAVAEAAADEGVFAREAEGFWSGAGGDDDGAGGDGVRRGV
jgi:hypothetical protein